MVTVKNEALFRWLSLPLSLLFNLLVFIIVPLAWPFLKIWMRKFKPYPMKKLVIGGPRSRKTYSYESIKLRDSCFLDNNDQHGALTHLHRWAGNKLIARLGLTKLQRKDGGLLRYASRNYVNNVAPSGDVMAAWLYAYVDHGSMPAKMITDLCDHLIANCFGMKGRTREKWMVSNKSDWRGMGWSFDGWKNLAPLVFGPQQWTMQAALAVAYEHGWKYKFWYWFYFIFYGGWFWAWFPLAFDPKFRRYYTDHIAVLNLSVLNKKRPSFFWRRPMRSIVKIHNEWFNPWFYAMLWDCGAERPKWAEILYARKVGWTFESVTDFHMQVMPSASYFGLPPMSGTVILAHLFDMLSRVSKRYYG